jgi:hypothetical protein
VNAVEAARVGFGIDSAIEGFASVIIVWRFTGSRVLSEQAERRAQSCCGLAGNVSALALLGGELIERARADDVLPITWLARTRGERRAGASVLTPARSARPG